MKNLIIQAFDTVIQRELAEEAEVREEMKRRGTYWAAGEIWKLRRQGQGATQAARRAGRAFAYLNNAIRGRPSLPTCWRRLGMPIRRLAIVL